MEIADITATFGPAAGDRATLSKSCRATLDALYRHPLAHNLEWADVIALFGKLGTVEHRSNNEFAFGIGGEHRLIRKSHGKELAADDVIALRHMLSRAGWSPVAAGPGSPLEDADTVVAVAPDLLVVMDHHEARLYQLDIRAADRTEHVIRPYDPHHFLHHLSHKDDARERGQRAAEDPSFYERIAQAVRPGGMIVLVGHGEGHSNAAHHLSEYLQRHHVDILRKLTCESAADLSSLTPPQLLEFGRRALSRQVDGALAG